MNYIDIFNLIDGGGRLSGEEALTLYIKAPTDLLVFFANKKRKLLHPDNRVGWMIDRNVNITNVCVSNCRFCNFCRPQNHPQAYITSIDEYREKIVTLFNLGGDQFLLQGGMHPELALEFYTSLFKTLKEIEPRLRLHALGPPEIVYLSKKEGLSYEKVLHELINAGLDSLPGAGAEILSDRVRYQLSPAKATTSEWLAVMEIAHQLGLVTSATMMFGTIETPEERIEHLISIRNLQDKKPVASPGFLSFIPWPFQDENTFMQRHQIPYQKVTMEDYIRLIAMSRLVLDNVRNIQASWLTVGPEVAQVCLHAGANDLGSIMIEENVVSAAGASFSLNTVEIQQVIRDAGFTPYRRNQRFEYYGS